MSFNKRTLWCNQNIIKSVDIHHYPGNFPQPLAISIKSETTVLILSTKITFTFLWTSYKRTHIIVPWLPKLFFAMQHLLKDSLMLLHKSEVLYFYNFWFVSNDFCILWFVYQFSSCWTFISIFSLLLIILLKCCFTCFCVTVFLFLECIHRSEMTDS